MHMKLHEESHKYALLAMVDSVPTKLESDFKNYQADPFTNFYCNKFKAFQRNRTAPFCCKGFRLIDSKAAKRWTQCKSVGANENEKIWMSLVSAIVMNITCTHTLRPERRGGRDSSAMWSCFQRASVGAWREEISLFMNKF